MARLFGEVEGERGSVSRVGHRVIRSHVRGWTLGVKVVGTINDAGVHEFQIFATGGSNEVISPVHLMTITEDEAEGFVTT